MTRWAVLFALLLPNLAAALSCVPYGPGDAYTQAAKAEEEYVVVVGQLDFDASRVPKTSHSGQDPDRSVARVPAQVTGEALVGSGFAAPFQHTIEMVVECIGPWCPSLASGEVHLVFLERQRQTHVLHVNTCRNDAFLRPTADDIGIVRDCHTGRVCRTFPVD